MLQTCRDSRAREEQVEQKERERETDSQTGTQADRQEAWTDRGPRTNNKAGRRARQLQAKRGLERRAALQERGFCLPLSK